MHQFDFELYSLGVQRGFPHFSALLIILIVPSLYIIRQQLIMYQEIYKAARRGDIDVVKGLIEDYNEIVRESVELFVIYFKKWHCD